MKMASGGLISHSNWGISVEWTDEEQKTLEVLMGRYTPERMDPVQRYVRMAAALPRKSVRDVALRVRWTMMQQQMKRRSGMDVMKAGAAVGAQQNPMMSMNPCLGTVTPPPMPLQGQDGKQTVDGPIAYLLDANLSILNQFRTNMASFKVHENTQLLVQFRDNILQILHAMDSMGGVMAQLPQLPVRLNTDLANNFLPSRPVGMLAMDGMMTIPPPPQPAINAPGMVPLNGLGHSAPGGQAARHFGMNAPPTSSMPPSSMPPPQTWGN